MNSLVARTIHVSDTMADVSVSAAQGMRVRARRTPESSLTKDLRADPRWRPEDWAWLQGVRFKYGPDVRVIDISKGGVLIETGSGVPCQSRVVFEFAGPDNRILIPARIVRSGLEVVDGEAVYRGAYAFQRPFRLADAFRADREQAASDEPVEPDTAAPLDNGYCKVIARYWDGLLLRGFTNDFHASRPHLHLSSHPTAGNAAFVPLSQLKALFFVRDFNGNPRHVEERQFIQRPQGRKIEVTFRDGEVLVGSTLNYRPDGQGFFVQPADARSNNLRVFVTHAAIRHRRFV
jgi:hypothetical protein